MRDARRQKTHTRARPQPHRVHEVLDVLQGRPGLPQQDALLAQRQGVIHGGARLVEGGAAPLQLRRLVHILSDAQLQLAHQVVCLTHLNPEPDVHLSSPHPPAAPR